MRIYDFEVKTSSGKEVSLSTYGGKVLVIVNTASKCGFTPQFKELEELYKKYGKENFEILGFPCNQFGNQEPGTNEEIHDFCQLNYGVSFTMFQKIEVNGNNAHPLFQFLKKEKGGISGDDIKWNFTKFLIDKEGNVVKRYAPIDSPLKMENEIIKLLEK